MGNGETDQGTCRFDLGFGNSVAVREAFVETVGAPHGGYAFTFQDILAMDYPVHEGDPKLVEITREVIRRQIRNEYKHVFITNGATGGVVIALRAYKLQGKEWCRTREAPYYSRYPGMVEASGLRRDHNFGYMKDGVVLLDMPSNPQGLLTEHSTGLNYPVILDAVYYNNVYCRNLVKPVPHDVLVGSYSKLFGVNGIRLGWLATNDDLLAERVKGLITAEYCGLDVPGTELIKRCWERFNWEYFEKMSNVYLNSNREEWSKLERFFGGKPVNSIGMFYYAPMDTQCKRLMQRSGVGYTGSRAMGTWDDKSGRFNIGQDMKLIREAVATILKNDRLR